MMVVVVTGVYKLNSHHAQNETSLPVLDVPGNP